MNLKFPRKAARESGFAFRDCVAIACLLSIFAFVGAPLRSRMNSTRDAVRCAANLKELAAAWQLYASDNANVLVENYHGAEAVNGTAANRPTTAPWALGWLDWSGALTDNTNIALIAGVKYARLSPYFGFNPALLKCPADKYVSSAQRARRWRERVRSYSLNITVGNGNAVTGPWDPKYQQVRKLNELLLPAPADTSLFLDEHPDSINGPDYFPPHLNSWIDVPGNLHNRAATISFADGHVEIHPWRGSLRATRVTLVQLISPRPSPNDPDYNWMQFHSQRRTAARF